MEQVASLIAKYYPASGQELCFGGLAVSALAREYGTPFYVYDQSAIEKKWSLLREALPSRFSIYYSVKANPNQIILQFFLGKGAGLEIASVGEFCQALSAGCQPENILFAGPGKTEPELDFVLRKGIGEIHVESLRELERVAAIARHRGIRARIAVRVNPGAEAEGGAMRMGGRPAPFGVDEESLEEVLDRALAFPVLDLCGIHLFTGTQILDDQILVNQYRKGIEIARRVATYLKRPILTLDFGGGLGTPYFANEQELDTQKFRMSLESLMKTVENDPSFSRTRFMVEPGRYLVSEAGIYVTRVNDIKISRGKKFLILDGGMNHHLAASGNLGQVIKRNYPVAILNRLNSVSDEVVDAVGPLCTPLDVLTRGVKLPKTEVGDLVGIFQSGAYGRSASPLGFLSHPAPPEVWIEGEKHRLIRRRGEVEDFLRDQVCAPETI